MKASAHRRAPSSRDLADSARGAIHRDPDTEFEAGVDLLRSVLVRATDGGSARRIVDGLTPRIGNAATASLLADPAHAQRSIDASTRQVPVQLVDGDGDVEAEELSEEEEPATSSSTVINVVNTTYSVSGDFLSVANQLAARTEAGSVTSQFSDIAYTPTPSGRVKYANVTVTETVSLPTWADRSKGSPAEQAEWDRFLAALRAHEQQHVAIDQAAYANIHTRLVGLTEAAADARIDQIENAATATNAEFDANTDHGRNAGTTINANVATRSTSTSGATQSAPAPAPTP